MCENMGYDWGGSMSRSAQNFILNVPYVRFPLSVSRECGRNLKTINPFVMLQAGSELFPVDSTGEAIDDNTQFLQTWEVSRTDKLLICMRRFKQVKLLGNSISITLHDQENKENKYHTGAGNMQPRNTNLILNYCTRQDQRGADWSKGVEANWSYVFF